jgi:HTH-type transcriptional regulator / antitoxin HigA
MDEARYGELLKELRPRIIETPEEHERLLTLAEELMERGENLTTEERQALALIVLLVEAFESTIEDEDAGEEGEEDGEEPPAPHVALARLMQSHSLALDDIAHIFGNPHMAREALDGKRAISRSQAKELGRYFRVPPKLFQEG